MDMSYGDAAMYSFKNTDFPALPLRISPVMYKPHVPVCKPPVVSVSKPYVPVCKPYVPVCIPPVVPVSKPHVPVCKPPVVPVITPYVSICKPPVMPVTKPYVPVCKQYVPISIPPVVPVSKPHVPVCKPPVIPVITPYVSICKQPIMSVTKHHVPVCKPPVTICSPCLAKPNKQNVLINVKQNNPFEKFIYYRSLIYQIFRVLCVFKLFIYLIFFSNFNIFLTFDNFSFPNSFDNSLSKFFNDFEFVNNCECIYNNFNHNNYNLLTYFERNRENLLKVVIKVNNEKARKEAVEAKEISDFFINRFSYPFFLSKIFTKNSTSKNASKFCLSLSLHV